MSEATKTYKPSWKVYRQWVKGIPVAVISTSLLFFGSYNIIAHSNGATLLVELFAAAIAVIIIMTILIGRTRTVVSDYQIVHYGVFRKKVFDISSVDGKLIFYSDTTSSFQPVNQTIPTLFIRDKNLARKRLRLSGGLYSHQDLAEICEKAGLDNELKKGTINTQQLFKEDPLELYWAERHPNWFVAIIVSSVMLALFIALFVAIIVTTS
jgi:hypothetical protein